MNIIESSYINTDFDLKSQSPLDRLHDELSLQCSVLHYDHGADGHYHASYESRHDDESSDSSAERDILLIVNALNSISDAANAELQTCYLREFNIGFDCGDTWGYVHSLPRSAIAAVVSLECSLAVTLYPMRHPDGKPRV